MFFFFKQKTAYGVRISDGSSDVCSSDLHEVDVIVGDERAEPFRDPAKFELHCVSNPLQPAALPVIIPSAFEHSAFGKTTRNRGEIGRASCRERVCQYV